MANELRVRSGFKKGTTGALLTNVGTTLTFAADPGFNTIGSTAHAAIILDPLGVNGAPEIVYITAYTATQTTATIVRAQEGTAAREHPNGTAWSHGPTIRDYPYSTYKATGLVSPTVSSTTFAVLNSGYDLSIPASIGDIVEIDVSASVNLAGSTVFFDAISLDAVGGNPVNSWGMNGAYLSNGAGVRAWMGVSSLAQPIGGSIKKIIVANDLVAGKVNIRFVGRVDSGSRVSNLHYFGAANLGPERAP